MTRHDGRSECRTIGASFRPEKIAQILPVPSEYISRCKLHYKSLKTHNNIVFEPTVLTPGLASFLSEPLEGVNYTAKFLIFFQTIL